MGFLEGLEAHGVGDCRLSRLRLSLSETSCPQAQWQVHGVSKYCACSARRRLRSHCNRDVPPKVSERLSARSWWQTQADEDWGVDRDRCVANDDAGGLPSVLPGTSPSSAPLLPAEIAQPSPERSPQPLSNPTRGLGRGFCPILSDFKPNARILSDFVRFWETADFDGF